MNRQSIAKTDVGVVLALFVGLLAGLVPDWAAVWKLVAASVVLLVGLSYLLIIYLRAKAFHGRAQIEQERERARQQLGAAHQLLAESEQRSEHLQEDLVGIEAARDRVVAELKEKTARVAELEAEVERRREGVQEVAAQAQDMIEDRDAELALLRHRDGWLNRPM